MSEVSVIDTEKKTKKVVKRIVVRRIVKRKKNEVEGEGEGEVEVEGEDETNNKPIYSIPIIDPIISENKTNVNVNHVDNYINNMDDMTRKAMCIAKDHLGSSFNLNKCNGYLSYLESTT